MEKQRDHKGSQRRQTKDLAPERKQRGAPSPAAAAEQFGATEQDVTQLTPPPSENPANKRAPGATTRQKAAEEIDPADELTPG